MLELCLTIGCCFFLRGWGCVYAMRVNSLKSIHHEIYRFASVRVAPMSLSSQISTNKGSEVKVY